MRALAVLAALALLAAPGCKLLERFEGVKQQQAKLDAQCAFRGTASTEEHTGNAIIVVLARRAGERWEVADHFVLERPGRFVLLAGAGTYGVSAFEDRNDDLVYQPGEPLVHHHTFMTCNSGEQFADIGLLIPSKGGARIEGRVDIEQMQARSHQDQLVATLGQLTATGELVTLSDTRFDQTHAENGLWRPYDFLFDTRAGIYFLQPYDPAKIPVLLVHGINGSPANFAPLVERLDHSRFQPWVYYYPSGIHIGVAAAHLAQTFSKLAVRYDFEEARVVAHSMGGLVARGFLQRYYATGGQVRIPTFVTLATPWGGHRGAAIGVATAPVVVRVWEDMAPGSAFLKELFAKPLPKTTAHYLIFTRKDEVVSLASELRPEAQLEARQAYGFDETHMGVLRNAEVGALVNRLLAGEK